MGINDFNYALSPRMRTIADMAIKGEPAADIGTDHGFIPMALLAEDIVPYVILTDINDGPIEVVKKHLIENNFSPDYYSVRQGDGISPLSPGEVSSVIIAGMGGELIESIIRKDNDKALSFKRFILQPRTHANEMRLYLTSSGFEYADYRLVKEKNRICEVIAFEPSSETKVDNTIVSPYLLSKDDPLILDFIDYKIKLASSVIGSLSNSSRDETKGMTDIWNDILNELLDIKNNL